MKRVLFKVILITALCSVIVFPMVYAENTSVTPLTTSVNVEEKVSTSTTDHSKHYILKDLKTVEEVTAACLRCHTEAGKQIHKTMHWTWIVPGDETKTIGKGGDTFNNFCTSIKTNEPRCTSCHIGYGWKDDKFDFASEKNIDCLVCHDNSGTYKKFPTDAGYPPTEPKTFEGRLINPPDFKVIIASIGTPKIENCGSCHFYGGGADGVKHGDLDSSLYTADRSLDVHMSKAGGNFDCQRCHTTEAHQIAGREYNAPAVTDHKSLVEDDQVKRISCVSCHTDKPHKWSKLNDHTVKIACQTCHIPTFARVKPTKMNWDWSTATKLKDGKPYYEYGEWGEVTYDSKKGDFIWAMNVVPEYKWYAGYMEYLQYKDHVDPSKGEIEITKVMGGPDIKGSKISPFKPHRAKLPFDPQTKLFLNMHLFGKDDSSLWSNYDWNKALDYAQNKLGREWSGEYVFVDTVYYFPTTHMVGPKEDSLKCIECHSADSRLKDVPGIWMPGHNNVKIVDMVGWLAVVGAIGGVSIHGLLRALAGRKKK